MITDNSWLAEVLAHRPSQQTLTLQSSPPHHSRHSHCSPHPLITADTHTAVLTPSSQPQLARTQRDHRQQLAGRGTGSPPHHNRHSHCSPHPLITTDTHTAVLTPSSQQTLTLQSSPPHHSRHSHCSPHPLITTDTHTAVLTPSSQQTLTLQSSPPHHSRHSHCSPHPLITTDTHTAVLTPSSQQTLTLQSSLPHHSRNWPVRSVITDNSWLAEVLAHRPSQQTAVKQFLLLLLFYSYSRYIV